MMDFQGLASGDKVIRGDLIQSIINGTSERFRSPYVDFRIGEEECNCAVCNGVAEPTYYYSPCKNRPVAGLQYTYDGEISYE